MVQYYTVLILLSISEMAVAGNHRPTLSEIARMNSAAWDSVYSVDMEWDTTSASVSNGKKTDMKKMVGSKWSRKGDTERLRRPLQVAANEEIYEDYFLDNLMMYSLYKPIPENSAPLSVCDQQGVKGRITPCMPRLLVGKSPELLQYFCFMGDAHPKTLSEIIAKWDVSLKDDPVVERGATLWCVHAKYISIDAGDPRTGNYIDIYVNADRNFMAQKAVFYDKGVAKDDEGKWVAVEYSLEVKEFLNCGGGVYFPRGVVFRNRGRADSPDNGDGVFATQTPTRLSINSAIPDQEFNFRFPENLLVRRLLADGAQETMVLWGGDNKPALEFHSEEEMLEYNRKAPCAKDHNKPYKGKDESENDITSPSGATTWPYWLACCVFGLCMILAAASIWRNRRKFREA